MEDLVQDLTYINELKNQAYEICYQILGETPVFLNPYWAIRLVNNQYGTEYTIDDLEITTDCLEYCEASIRKW